MIFAETGRFPLAIDVNIQIIKYGVKILRSEESSYKKLVYSKMFQNPIKHEWIRYVKNLLCSSGFSGIWNNNLCKTKGSSLSSLSNEAKIYIMQNDFNVIRKSSRCRMYKEIKQVHKKQRDI